jgi:alkanesulfonate monooxygenase SsuD/methylene tetrahydromethanopterin reductase-like flavin-dependent oxidoreductase (luciferase family)
MQALEIYRAEFRPSTQLDRPYAMVGLNICAADSDQEASRLFTSLQQQWTELRRGAPGALPPPVDSMDGLWAEHEKEGLQHALALAIIGGPDTVRRRLADFIARTGVDEIMMTSQVYDHAARLRSYEIVAGLRASLDQEADAA